MKTPECLETLVDHGIIQEVVRPLMSGKEAQIYVVLAGGGECVAKVYKEADQRTFKHRAEYTEGRRTRNSRDRRAVSKRTRHGRKQDEAAWRSTEVDMIYRLRDAGVRVAKPINFVDGVLVMELVQDAQGHPAPRLGDLSFEAKQAREIYRSLIQEVVRMLCAGVVHGDLSDFNVLMGADGPVLIDFPQSVDPAHNPSARKLLLRDVENLHRFVARFAPDQPRRAYAEEMWSLYESNRLAPESELSGEYRAPAGKANTDEVLALIDDANLDERGRRRARGLEAPVSRVEGPKPLREVVDFTKQARRRPDAAKRAGTGRGTRAEKSRSRSAEERVSTKASPEKGAAAPKKTRRRRRRRGGRASSRKSSEEARAGTQTNAKRTARPAAGARSGTGSGAEEGGARRPSRRRRRRSSTGGSREAT
jgi:RIO kinase 1